MIHHVSLGTNDLKRARIFYDAVLPVLGLKFLKQTERLVGYGLTDVIFSLETPKDGGKASVGNGTHVAFHAGSRKNVEAFYRAGLAHGGRDDGAPGIRKEYDPHYYAAFLRDPDGNKVEAVSFCAE
jgi:catechol 2,3-dioxygenase-like lactoylglutathione lyase family enzyme